MKRRDFSALFGLAGASALPGLMNVAQAQGGPIEGRQYQRLGQPLPTQPGKIEVIEFFGYSCPHCFAFDPVLEAWLKTLPADVSFRRAPAGFNAMYKLHQKLFYALEAMGKLAQVHESVFNAFHKERLDLSDEKSITAMVARLGVDPAKFKEAFNSFGVQTKATQATKLSEAYRIDGVPALGVAGRFWTSPSMAGVRGQSEIAMGQQALAVVEHLIKLSRNKA